MAGSNGALDTIFQTKYPRKRIMPELTLYRKDGACSIAAHMLLRELQLPFRDVPMRTNADDVYEGAEGTDLTRETWLKISPTGYVPALTVDGETITELSAVLLYIASLAPERHLTGRRAIETAKVLEWMSWLSTEIQEYAFVGRWAPTRMVGRVAAEEVLDAVREHGKEGLVKGFASIESRIQGTVYAIKDQLTAVDLMLHTFWRWGVLSGYDMEQYSKFKAVVKEVENLKGFREALKIEGVDLQFP